MWTVFTDYSSLTALSFIFDVESSILSFRNVQILLKFIMWIHLSFFWHSNLDVIVIIRHSFKSTLELKFQVFICSSLCVHASGNILKLISVSKFWFVTIYHFLTQKVSSRLYKKFRLSCYINMLYVYGFVANTLTFEYNHINMTVFCISMGSH